MVRSQSILLLVCVCFNIYTYSQSLTGPETANNYSTAQKRLLVQSTASFINVLTQDNLDRDSVMLMACRITGIPFLLAYTENFNSELPTVGADLINTEKIDDAIQLLKTLEGEKRLQLSINLATWYLHKTAMYKADLDSANQYIQAALKLSSAIGNSNKHYECLLLLGEYYRQGGDESKSREIFLQMISSGKLEGNKKVTASAWNHLGQLHAEVDSLDLSYLNSSLTLYHLLQLKEKEIELLWRIASYHRYKLEIAQLQNDLALILELQKSVDYKHSLFAEYLLSFTFLIQSKYLDAIEHANTAIENMKWSGISALEGSFYMRLGAGYYLLGKNDEALTFFKKGLENRTKETHLFWFKSLIYATELLSESNRPKESLSMMEDVVSEFPPVTPWEKAQVFSVRGDCYVKLNDYKSADENYTSLLQLINKYPDIDRYGEFGSRTFVKMAEFYLLNSNIEKGRMLVKKIVSLNRNEVYYFIDKNYILFKLDSIKGNFKSAINYYAQYKLWDDSAKSIEQRKKFDELTIKSVTEKKDREIKLQHATLLQAKYTRNWILGAVGLLMVIVGLLLRNARLKQRTNKKLETQRIAIEKQNVKLRHVVDEKDWLVKEIHHRVKNNLQIVMSLLNSQSVFIENDAALTAIHDSQHRVQAMSLIHQKLYTTENVSSIDMSSYIRELVSYLSDSFNTGQRIRFEYNIEPLELDVSQAVPLGLILNEAITNSIKYAFPNEREGVIKTTLSNTSGNQYLLKISDNGIGIPSHLKNKNPGSLGMSLMAGLSEDLDGNFSIENNDGTTIRISFVYGQIVKWQGIPASSIVNN